MPTTGAHGIIIPDPSTATATVNQVRDLAIQTEAGLADVEATVAAAIDLDSYATKTYVGSALSSYATKSYVDSAVADGGTSGSLIPLTGNVTTPAGTKQGELVGYRNFGTTTRTVNGESVPPGEYAIFTWTGTMWIRIDTPAGPPDTEPPTAPTNLQATPGANDVTLTWTAATDNRGIGGYEARVQQDGTPTWSTWTALASGGSLTGLTPTTGYTAQVRALDFAGNAGPSASTTFTTTAVPLTGDITDTFTAPDDTLIIGRTTTTGGKTWVAETGTATTSLTGRPFANSPVIKDGAMTMLSGDSPANLVIDPGPVEVSFDFNQYHSGSGRIIVAIGVGQRSDGVGWSILRLEHVNNSNTSLYYSNNNSGSTPGGTSTTYVDGLNSGRFTLRWDGINAEVFLNGTSVIGPVVAPLTETGKLGALVRAANASIDNLAVTYL